MCTILVSAVEAFVNASGGGISRVAWTAHAVSGGYDDGGLVSMGV